MTSPMKKILIIAFAAAMAVSCGSSSKYTRASQYPRMYETKPITLLVMPPINNTTNVDAKEALYTTISKPLIEAGYYVISPYLAFDALKAESAYDAEQFVNVPLTKFSNYFGCDAVVFSEINTWKKHLGSIQTDIRYFIRDAVTGETIFDRSCSLSLSFSGGGTGGWLRIITDAIQTAVTDHVVAARKANRYIFNDIPRGKYSEEYQKDQETPANKKDVSANVQ